MAIKLHPPINGSVLEGLSKILGETNKGLTGPEIAKFLQEVGIRDIDSGITKWKRLYNAFANYQNEKQHSNNILAFITKSMNPARFVGRSEQFEDLRFELNKILSFIGLQFSERGKFSLTVISTTISEAEQKANKFKSKLQQRNVHDNIYEFCRAELLAENYFHSVFEATKSIAEKIRQTTGLTQDGSELIDQAFSIRNPLIRINDLSTETKQSEHKGFANLIKGVFGMFRNTTAHAPRIIWEITEEDALDIMSTISLIHRKLELEF
ncbi:TIGR02391 family protein [Flavobacterium sp. KACC 22758]|uniref:TIGR02391 family protein n=1 Tax=Flavobacterium sp. KACC 22758 TaxID=3025667 RepID=UPI0023666F7C|nr:TIGR02391 family protein [Flavobacterium sp. KACC 22758]WDF59439.1 TIGR02391 family protein [Flavobacterium sp. KACC 22758]